MNFNPSPVTEGTTKEGSVTTVAPKVPGGKEKEGSILEVDEETEIGINEKEHPGKKKVSILQSSIILIDLSIKELEKKIVKVRNTVIPTL